MSHLLEIIVLCTLCYIGLCIFMGVRQKHFIFHPTQIEHSQVPPECEPFILMQNEGTLRGWLLHPEFATQRLVLYYGGNSEDVYHTREQFLHFKDTAILLVNYRGYGTSEGIPSEAAFFADALAIFDRIVAKASHQTPRSRKIFVMGRSLGSSVAGYVASQRRVDGIILVTPFFSLQSIAQRRYPFLPIALILRHCFASFSYAEKFQAPVLVLYGGNDRTVPSQNTEEFIKHIAAPTRVVRIEEAEHNTIEFFEEYQLALLRFLSYTENNKDEQNIPLS